MENGGVTPVQAREVSKRKIRSSDSSARSERKNSQCGSGDVAMVDVKDEITRFNLGHIDDIHPVAPMETPLTVRKPQAKKTPKTPKAELDAVPAVAPLKSRSKKCGGSKRSTSGGSTSCTAGSSSGNTPGCSDGNTAGSSAASVPGCNDGNTEGSSSGNTPESSDGNTTGSSAPSTPRVRRKKRRVTSLEETNRCEKRARFPVSVGSEDEFEEEDNENDFHIQVFSPRSLAIQSRWLDSDDEEESAEWSSHVNNPLKLEITLEDGPAPRPGLPFEEGEGANSIPSAFPEPRTESPSAMANFVWDPLRKPPTVEEGTATHPVLGSEEAERASLIAPLEPTPESTKGMYNFVWEPLPNNPIPMQARRERFTGPEAGPTKPVVSPIDSFLEIWNDAIMETIVEETNKYAEQLIAQAIENELGQMGRLKRWKKTNVTELYVYFALNLAMGVLIKTDVTDYWQTSTVFRTPGFSEMMNRNRFQLLNRCLHFVDNESPDASNLSPQEAKLFKIAPVIAHLNERFQVLYNLGQNITIDESLTQWKGRQNVRQCTPKKAASMGIKAYEICESQTGYLYKFEVHAGRDDEPVDGDVIHGYIPNLVLRLVRGIEHRGHTLFMDKFYNSPALARTLKVLGFDVVGTLRTNIEHVPKEIHDLKLGKIPMQRGQMFGCTSGDVDLMVWKDLRNVPTISTYHGLSGYYDCREFKREPTLIRDYNVSMGGVDKRHQILSTYPVERKKVWYKKLFTRMMNVSVLNAYVIYTKSKGAPKLTHVEFRYRLVNGLLDRFGIKAPPLPPPTRGLGRVVMSLECTKHFTVPTGYVIPGAKQRIRRRCVYCKGQCRTECAECNVGLHVGECSQKYHQGQRKQ